MNDIQASWYGEINFWDQFLFVQTIGVGEFLSLYPYQSAQALLVELH